MASSLLLNGRTYSAWLPPVGDPHAPKDQWIRVRKLDNVHLCPEGSARYADAILSDLTAIFALAPANRVVDRRGVDDGPGLQRPARRLPRRSSLSAGREPGRLTRGPDSSPAWRCGRYARGP